MDNIGLPVHGAEVEENVFGTLPTLWLQQHVLRLWQAPLEWTSAVIHASWFFVPELAAALVAWARPRRVASLFSWWTALLLIVLPLFALFPLRPPWMASEEITRVIAVHLGRELDDPNLLAAMPSLHVALPLLISLWFLREHWKTPAIVMLSYSAIVAFEVVFSGEHYVVDVIGAALVAVGVMLLARLDYRGAFGRVSQLVAKPVATRERPKPVPQPEPVRPLYGAERGQTLIEFAFIAPIVFILLFTIVDFGIALDRRITIQHAVREGARAAGVKGDPLAAQQATAAQAQDLIAVADVDVCYEDDGNGQPDALEPVTVSTSFTYEFTIPFGSLLGAIGIDVGPGIEMTPDATSALENTPLPGAGFVECPP